MILYYYIIVINQMLETLKNECKNMNYKNKLEYIWLYKMCTCSISWDLVVTVDIRNEHSSEKIMETGKWPLYMSSCLNCIVKKVLNNLLIKASHRASRGETYNFYEQEKKKEKRKIRKGQKKKKKGKKKGKKS